MIKINVIIPMAGNGRRFKDAGFKKPKPLIDCAGKTMIERAMESFQFTKTKYSFTFIVLAEHTEVIKFLKDKGQVIILDEVTEGAVCTVLKAKEIINNRDPLIIANCDQYIKWNIESFISAVKDYAGGIVTFNSTNPHHSYAKVWDGLIVEVAEKRVISDNASAGVYYFRHGDEFVIMADRMIEKNIRTNNEFYITPVYNEFIDEGYSLRIFEINVNKKHMLGTPEELNIFIDKVQEGIV